MGDLLVVAFFAAAKEITSVGHQWAITVGNEGEIRPPNPAPLVERDGREAPPLYSGRCRAVHNMTAGIIWERKEQS
jgi:hypothetical protein